MTPKRCLPSSIYSPMVLPDYSINPLPLMVLKEMGFTSAHEGFLVREAATLKILMVFQMSCNGSADGIFTCG